MIKTKENLEDTFEGDIDKCSKDWIKYLCSVGNEHHYQKISVTSKSEILAIMKYRRVLREKGFGNVSFIELNAAYEGEDDSKLHRLLEMLFLEPLTKQQYYIILDKIENTDGGMVTFYNKHKENINKRALTIALEV